MMGNERKIVREETAKESVINILKIAEMFQLVLSFACQPAGQQKSGEMNLKGGM